MSDYLTAWDGYTLKLNLEESEDDIVLKIKYEDHGDEYLLVKTKSGEMFEYGMWVNIDNFNRFDHTDWIRKTELYCKEDEHCKMSNDRFFWCEREMFDSSWYKYRIYDKYRAQYIFEMWVHLHDQMYESNIYYKANDYKYKTLSFLEKNGINTEENLKIVETIHFDSKRDGFDGVCGKRKITSNDIYCDSIRYVIYNGKRVWAKVRKGDTDDWGCITKILSLNQFK